MCAARYLGSLEMSHEVKISDKSCRRRAPEQGDGSIQVKIRQMVWNKAEDVKTTVRQSK